MADSADLSGMPAGALSRRAMLGRVAAAAAAVSIAPAVLAAESPLRLAPVAGAKPRNILFILTDDHRYDAMGFMNHPFLQTPNLDALARNGAHVQNAFVTTALCSPSRATILTGLYAHQHKVVDNNNPVPPGTVFFPQYLQAAGYETAFFGKWHMGGAGDDPQPGFDHWVSFRGQGTYLPNANGLNINGQHVPQKGYITDELTDYALDWLEKRSGEKPFFMYLSHKAVHAEFRPADRHAGRYKNAPFTPPKTMTETEEDRRTKPRWVRDQRNSWHGVDFPYHGELDIADYYRRYCETFLAVDDSIGRLVDFLKRKNLLESTLIVYMGDNGFMFGEHGLIDKRTAYEESIRVPMVMHCPQLIPDGTKVTALAANLDIAPTFLDAAGLQPPKYMEGRSLLPLAAGRSVPWRDHLLYVYLWERNFPQTPTMHAIRTDRYKYIHYYGVWDLDELYDLREDPQESRNLVNVPAMQPTLRQLRKRLFDRLTETGGMYIPLYRDSGGQQNKRRQGGEKAANFPDSMILKTPETQPEHQ